jgi:hypothetical protein
MGGIYEVRRSDGLSCHDIHNKLKVDGGGGGYKDTEIHRQHGDRISLLWESRLKT